MRPSRRILSLSFSIAIGVVASPAVADVIVPGGLTGIEGNTNNAFPFINTAAGMRYQQVYGASEFSTMVLIDAVLFRPDALIASAVSGTLSSVQIDLSTTTFGPDGLSSTFATNIGADNGTVFSGALLLSTSNTGPGPKNFDVQITFTTPFLYDPALGNLLLDVRNFGGGSWSGFALDAHNAADSISRVFSSPSNVAATSGLVDSRGLVTKFRTRAVPEPATLLLIGGGLAASMVGRRLSRRC